MNYLWKIFANSVKDQNMGNKKSIALININNND